jgi:hypothetical protein
VENMKKIISLGLVLGMAAFLVWALPASAKNEGRPKGLEDRGPLTKITFIHYKKGHAKPPKPPGKDKDKKVACYGFLGRGVYWKDLPQELVITSDNPDGMTKKFIVDAFVNSAEVWDAETSKNLYSVYKVEDSADWDDDVPDGRNELSFGDYPKDGVIAVANVWGYFGGPPQFREIIEFDILFDTDFTWGDADKDNTVMDLENIATHEMGHGWGLDDMYDTACSDVTMYGYSKEGEITKRTLETPDIKGIQELYGVSF